MMYYRGRSGTDEIQRRRCTIRRFCPLCGGRSILFSRYPCSSAAAGKVKELRSVKPSTGRYLRWGPSLYHPLWMLAAAENRPRPRQKTHNPAEPAAASGVQEYVKAMTSLDIAFSSCALFLLRHERRGGGPQVGLSPGVVLFYILQTGRYPSRGGGLSAAGMALRKATTSSAICSRATLVA